MSDWWKQPAETITDEMLAVFARQCFKRRDTGLERPGLGQDRLNFSGTAWDGLTRERALYLLEEAERRGIIYLA